MVIVLVKALVIVIFGPLMHLSRLYGHTKYFSIGDPKDSDVQSLELPEQFGSMKSRMPLQQKPLKVEESYQQ